MFPINGVNPDRIIDRALENTAQIPPSVNRDGITSSAAFGWGGTVERGAFLPPWGTRQREWALRRLYRMDEMNMFRGAVVGICKTIAGLSWEIKGDTDEDPIYGQMAAAQGWRLRKSSGVEYFQEVFRQAEFGAGWGTFVTMCVADFLRYDAGGYIEVIAQGPAFDKATGPLMGLAHLDPLRCYPTGDPLYPAVYYDRFGGLNVMHHSRVIRLVDQVDGDELRPGYGDSALSRSVSIALAEINMSRYINMKLDDVPAPGIDIFGGVSKQEMSAVDLKYQQQRQTDGQTTYGRRVRYYAMDPAHMPKIESYEFSQAPELFDYREYTDINIDRLALALGVDRQELMALRTGNMGSGAQSEILAQKSRGKTIGFLVAQFARRLNDVLPDDYTFKFKQRDSQEEMETVDKAGKWAEFISKVGTALSPAEQRTLLANTVEAVQDAIQDAPRANDIFNQPQVGQDNTVGSAPVAPIVPTPATPTQIPATTDTPAPDTPRVNPFAKKDYQTTLAAFTNDVRDLLLSATTPNPYLDRKAFGVTMRSLLKRYGLDAFKDGQKASGLYVNELDIEDEFDYMRVYMDQAQYINGLADDVFNKKTVTPANADARASLWGKSLQAFDDAGMYSANKNGNFVWRYGDAEHCPDCLRLNGQVHRIRNWKASGFMPRANKLKCQGYNCKCTLERTTDTARGRF